MCQKYPVMFAVYFVDDHLQFLERSLTCVPLSVMVSFFLLLAFPRISLGSQGCAAVFSQSRVSQPWLAAKPKGGRILQEGCSVWVTL